MAGFDLSEKPEAWSGDRRRRLPARPVHVRGTCGTRRPRTRGPRTRFEGGARSHRFSIDDGGGRRRAVAPFICCRPRSGNACRTSTCSGTFLSVKAVINTMLEQRSGTIITVASVEGLEGAEGGSTYNASKGGVILLTKNLAMDYSRMGIRSNCICPGFIDTPLFQSVIGSARAWKSFATEHRGAAQDRPLRSSRGDRRGGVLPRVGRLVVRDRPRAARRRRLHRGPSARPHQADGARLIAPLATRRLRH